MSRQPDFRYDFKGTATAPFVTYDLELRYIENWIILVRNTEAVNPIADVSYQLRAIDGGYWGPAVSLGALAATNTAEIRGSQESISAIRITLTVAGNRTFGIEAQGI